VAKDKIIKSSKKMKIRKKKGKGKVKKRGSEGVPFDRVGGTDSENEFEVELPAEDDLTGNVKDGKYPGRCINIVKKTAKDSGNPMFVWTMVIDDGEYAGKDFNIFTVHNRKSMWKMAEMLVAFGIAKPGENIKKVKFSRDDIIGKTCILVIEKELWSREDGGDGKLRSKVKKCLPDG